MELTLDDLNFISESLKYNKKDYEIKSNQYVNKVDGYVKERRNKLNQFDDIIIKINEEKKRLKNGS